jgi:hypothetical protein
MIAITAFLSSTLLSQAQDTGAPQPSDAPATIFPHTAERFWLSGQMNFIIQAHSDFPARYSGPDSLKNTGEHALSRVFTLYSGLNLARNSELLFDAETTGGRGISDALGLAGFTNVDVVRNPDLGPKPYIARFMLHQIVPLSNDQEEEERTPFSYAKELPKKRIEIRAGKFSAADFFDTNPVGSDSHLQFTNWTTVNNGAYDYAADTRGYTYGVIVDYEQPHMGVRFGEMLMPKVANGIDLDWDVRRAHAENIEFVFRPTVFRSKSTGLKVLSYANTANMGVYREAIAAFKSGADATPDITEHRHQGELKYGFGFNADQELPAHFRAFLRAGWNEGRHESFAYTEVNNTASVGVDLAGVRWHRTLDKIGSAFVTNGISAEHAEYLQLGGRGFLLGDGSLRYGRETIWETYYTSHLWRGLFASAQIQFISNPGYNQDRGPVWVPGLRLHVEF